jgi:glycosyltransferase involved in cell wall biosynthesis
MACGAPAVVAPYPAAAEVLGDAAERIPLDVDRWVDALARLTSEPADVRAARSARGRAQAAKHSWESGADAVLEACRSVVAGAPREPTFARGMHGADRGPAPARAAAASPRADSPDPGRMRVAVVHDWLTGMRGGERVLQEMLEVFPDAELFTLLHVPGTVAPLIEDRPVHTSFIQSLPAAATHYRWYLPLFPRAIEAFDFSGFDLVLSSSHCVAKGARTGRVPHLCYCHTPMRYAWDQFDAYFGRGAAGAPLRAVAGVATRRLREWDRASAARVHRFVANSEHVRARIRAAYGRDASVLHPPVDVNRFQPAAAREDFYLVVSALVPYKRVELAVRALAELGRPLVVVGSGPEEARLRALAGPSVRFAGWLPDDEVADLMGRCRALIMPGVEDFGIAPVEAQAAGAPVIALGQGGALETVAPRDEDPSGTGVFFREPTVAALREAVLRSERLDFRADALRANAERFRPERFREGIAEAVEALLAGDLPQGTSSR